MIAEVALATTIRGATPIFSYSVPQRLRSLVEPGQLVWAPLQRRRVQGVVLELGSSAGGGLRDLVDVADPEARLTPAGIALARWVSATYRAPLYEALALLLPPGVSQEAEVTWRATPEGMAAELGVLPARERAVLYLVRQRGEISERDLRGELRGSDGDLREAYAALYERGLLARGSLLSLPRARPRIERFARLSLPHAEAAALLEQLGQAPRQRAVLEWLLNRLPAGNPDSDGTSAALPAAEIYAATGADGPLLQALARKGLLALERREVRRDPLAGDGVAPDLPPPLTLEQARAVENISVALEQILSPSPSTPIPFLLHGVTGSGKTEVYLRVIARALRLGRQALVIVPEIALTTQLVRRFAARFPGQLAVLHSGLSLGERYDEWRRLRRGVARLAIGSRSAVFAPLPELGLIIVDEEHEPTFKHDASPRYHARDAALRLGTLANSVVVLGSATPSVESARAAREGRLRLLELRERVGATPGHDGLIRAKALPLPPVRLVDMRREIQSGNRSIFSRALQQALAETLERREQVILFLNRRGAASFVMCRDCGHVVGCPACSGPLTVHYEEGVGGRGQGAGIGDREDEEHSRDPGSGIRDLGSRIPDPDPRTPNSELVCHSCGQRQIVPTICPQCLSPRIKDFGVGTQRVVEEVARLFPEARTLRWDRDSVRGKGAHGRMLDIFLRHEADVLVGTQMIAKGLDLPLVSLVGVVAADIGLHLPDFRSGERGFQLLTQVAGRAGRRAAGAKVLLQTYAPEHYALRAASEHDYAAFYIEEIAFRRQTGYPPFGRLVRFLYASGSERNCRREASALAGRLGELVAGHGEAGWGIVGPAPAFIQRQRGRYRWHLFLRLSPPPGDAELAGLLDSLGPLYGWVVDVDPVNVL